MCASSRSASRAMSPYSVTFVYGGDILVMPKSGGDAERLTSARGEGTTMTLVFPASRLARKS